MAKLSWTFRAEDELREIYAYIARDRPTTAARTVESIVNRIESLRESSELGLRYPYEPERRVHVFTYGHFRISLLVDEDGNLTVLGVFHGLIFLPPF